MEQQRGLDESQPLERAAILPSTPAMRASVLFQRASGSPPTSRLAGSASSYCRKARLVA
jgi:hypothetical protein